MTNYSTAAAGASQSTNARVPAAAKQDALAFTSFILLFASSVTIFACLFILSTTNL